jgi:hypothetical protein
LGEGVVVGNIGCRVKGEKAVLPQQKSEVFGSLFGSRTDWFVVSVWTGGVWADDRVEVTKENGISHCR